MSMPSPLMPYRRRSRAVGEKHCSSIIRRRAGGDRQHQRNQKIQQGHQGQHDQVGLERGLVHGRRDTMVPPPGRMLSHRPAFISVQSIVGPYGLLGGWSRPGVLVIENAGWRCGRRCPLNRSKRTGDGAGGHVGKTSNPPHSPRHRVGILEPARSIVMHQPVDLLETRSGNPFAAAHARGRQAYAPLQIA